MADGRRREGKVATIKTVNCQSAKTFPLKEKEAVRLNWRVEAAKLGKDKAWLLSNDFLMLNDIRAEVYDDRLDNCSALKQVIDQYRGTRDEQGNVLSDANRLDDERYIVRLIIQVTTMSLDTMKAVKRFTSGTGGSCG